MFPVCKKLATHPQTEAFILAVIAANALALGFETFPDFADQYEVELGVFYFLSQIIFSIEIAIRVLAFAPRMRDFFKDGWNAFDFTVVALCWIPASGPFVSVARLLRLLRLVRIVSVNDELREFVSSLFAGARSLVYLAVICGLVTYIYAVLGSFLFSDSRPESWRNLFVSAHSLVRVLFMLESGTAVADASPAATVFFASYKLFALFNAAALIALVVRRSVHPTSHGEA